MFERILVPLDGSELAQEALPLAARIARADGSKLILTRAIEAEMMMVPAGFEYEVTYDEEEQTRRWEQARAYVQDIQVSDRLKGISTSAVTKIGNPASVILDTAADRECDLIVMTTHGYRGLTRWMLGSVTERVLRNATCPVLVLRENRPIQHILVPLDGSKLAEEALDPALELAERLDAAVTLLRVDDSLSLMDYASMDALDQYEPGMAEQMRVSYAHRGETYLDDVRDRLDTTVPVFAISALGKPVDVILDTVLKEACDLVVMSTHGRSGVSRWVYGSVTEKVLRSAETPLLIVRPEFD